MIKLIIFDLSGVCCNAEEPPYVEEFTKKHNIDLDEFGKIYYPLTEKAEVDEITATDVWETILTRFNLKANSKSIMHDMLSKKIFFKDMLDLVKHLKKTHKTAFFTNYSKEYWDIIKQKFDLSDCFDFGLVSYEIKSRKPDLKGFKNIMNHFNVSPEETVFIDDSLNNIEKAKEIGITTILFQNKNQLMEALDNASVG